MELSVSESRARRWRGLPVLMLVLALAGCEGDAQEESGGQQQPPPPTVTTTPVELQRIEVREDYAGRIRGAREVEVRARVEGIVTERNYVEGQVVEAGDQLFQIDPEPFKASLAQAEAERQRAEASLNQARRDWERVAALYEDGAVSTRERDDALSTLELARAELALADASVHAAEIELGYTTVNAPASGVTSLEVLPEGSLASRGDLLTTVTQLDPVHVRFSLPEQDALAQNEARRAMTNGSEANGKRDAVLVLPNGDRYGHEGVVDFTEASIDPATGTVRARAVFPNPDSILTPGLFVRVELPTATLENVAVIPERAVASSEQGPAVFVVDPEGMAAMRPVELGPVVPEGQVVESGLQDGDRVIVSGLGQLSDGIQVTVEGEGGNGGQGDAR